MRESNSLKASKKVSHLARWQAVAGISLGVIGCLCAAAQAVILNWDASGASPANPVQASGFWNLQNTNWVNVAHTQNLQWVNGDNANFPGGLLAADVTVTINDPSGSVTAGGISGGSSSIHNYTIAAIPGDSLILSSPVIQGGIFFISAPIGGTVGMDLSSGNDKVVLEGQNTYTGTTSIGNLSQIVLNNGASLGNTSIVDSNGGSGTFLSQGITSAGTTGAGTSGATMSISGIDNAVTHAGQATLWLADSTMTLNQQTGFTGNAISFNNARLQFSFSSTDSELIENGLGTASVTGVNLLDMDLGLVPDGIHTLVTDPNGGLLGNFAFSNGLQTETTVGSNSIIYSVQIIDTDTALAVQTTQIGIVPEPASLGILACGSLMLCRRKRRA